MPGQTDFRRDANVDPGLAFREFLHLQFVGSALAPPSNSQHRRHLYQVHCGTFWSVTQKPLDGLELLDSKNGSKNVSAFD